MRRRRRRSQFPRARPVGNRRLAWNGWCRRRPLVDEIDRRLIPTLVHVRGAVEHLLHGPRRGGWFVVHVTIPGDNFVSFLCAGFLFMDVVDVMAVQKLSFAISVRKWGWRGTWERWRRRRRRTWRRRWRRRWRWRRWRFNLIADACGERCGGKRRWRHQSRLWWSRRKRRRWWEQLHIRRRRWRFRWSRWRLWTRRRTVAGLAPELASVVQCTLIDGSCNRIRRKKRRRDRRRRICARLFREVAPSKVDSLHDIREIHGRRSGWRIPRFGWNGWLCRRRCHRQVRLRRWRRHAVHVLARRPVLPDALHVDSLAFQRSRLLRPSWFRAQVVHLVRRRRRPRVERSRVRNLRRRLPVFLKRAFVRAELPKVGRFVRQACANVHISIWRNRGWRRAGWRIPRRARWRIRWRSPWREVAEAPSRFLWRFICFVVAPSREQIIVHPFGGKTWDAWRRRRRLRLRRLLLLMHILLAVVLFHGNGRHLRNERGRCTRRCVQSGSSQVHIQGSHELQSLREWRLCWRRRNSGFRRHHRRG